MADTLVSMLASEKLEISTNNIIQSFKKKLSYFRFFKNTNLKVDLVIEF